MKEPTAGEPTKEPCLRSCGYDAAVVRTGDRSRRAIDGLGGIAGVAALAVIIVVACVEAVHLVRARTYPAEDAAILMRYAANFAAGHGITFNPGHHAVDGATDFGLMLMLAALIKAGLSASGAVLVLDVVAHLVTVVVVYVTAQRVVRASVAVSVVAAGVVALGPGMFYAQSRYGTQVFACAVAVTWALAIWAERLPSRTTFRWFAIAGLVTGLIRPEGVIVFVLAAVALALRLDRQRRRMLLRAIFIFFVPAGAAYFAFHWAYFGYPLPNPFYKKSGGRLHTEGVREAVRFMVTWVAPVAVLYVLALRRRWRVAAFHAIPVAGFALAWILLSNETNYINRFQYPLLVMIALSLPPLWEAAKEDYPEVDGRAVVAAGAVGVLALALLFARGYRKSVREAAPGARNSLFTVAKNLRDIPGRHRIAVTEAGLLPFYSGWTTLDLWGLNDEAIAHHGLSAADIDRFQPDVMMVHWAPDSFLQGWHAMNETAVQWAASHNYILVANYGTSGDNTHMYFVRPGSLATAITAAVRVSPYYLPFNGPGTTKAVPDRAAPHP